MGTGWIQRTAGALALAAAALLQAGPAEEMFQGAWEWRLQPRQYGKLSQPERTHYTRAEELVRNGQFEAAALEFEKFIAAFPKTEVYAHALLMQGYGYHLARYRNKAIERYNEVLDFFGDHPDAAAPAGFLKGMALIQNGNEEAGFAVFEQVAARDDYRESPVADLALVRLAERYLARQEWDKAERCWNQIITAFQDAFFGRPPAIARAARQALTDLYLRQGKMDALTALYTRFPLEGRKAADQTVAVLDRAMAIVDSIPEKGRPAVLDWIRSRGADFRDEGREGEWWSRTLSWVTRAELPDAWSDLSGAAIAHFAGLADTAPAAASAGWLAARLGEAEGRRWPCGPAWKAYGAALAAIHARLDEPGRLLVGRAAVSGFSRRPETGSGGETVWMEAVGRVRDLFSRQLNPDKDNGLAWLVDRLRGLRYFDQALAMAQRIERPALAQWKAIEVLGNQERYADQAMACAELEQLDDKEFSVRALRQRAYLYHVRLNKCDEAIKLYAMLNEPPSTIWSTADCYVRLKKPESAVAALGEIESFFERDAPRAALQKAVVWEQAGDKVKAIAALRGVLKKYPKSAQASQAHQMLERYGVATGGGVIDED